jgi:hypothetical protein
MSTILFRIHLVLLCIALAGCGSPPQESDEPAPGCDACLVATEAVLTDCSQIAYMVELPTKTYDLPANFTDSPTAPSSAQLLLVNFNRCAEGRVGTQTFADVSIGYSGVRVESPGRGPEVDVDIFDVEVLTDSPALADLLRRGSGAAVHGSVTFADAGPERRASVRGDIQYDITSEIPRFPGQSFEFRENHFGEGGQLTWVAECSFFGATAPVITQTTSGRLTEAAQAGLLAGHGGQPISCDITINIW